jgi:hypothetical protein
MLIQADALTEKQLKRREYYQRRKEYYTAQNKVWRDATEEQLIAFAKGVLAVHSKAG